MIKGLKYEIVGNRHFGVFFILGLHVSLGLYFKKNQTFKLHRTKCVLLYNIKHGHTLTCEAIFLCRTVYSKTIHPPV